MFYKNDKTIILTNVKIMLPFHRANDIDVFCRITSFLRQIVGGKNRIIRRSHNGLADQSNLLLYIVTNILIVYYLIQSV